jgi:hypothetical protein
LFVQALTRIETLQQAQNGGVMEQIAKRVGLAVLGVVVTLAYWSFTGGGDAGSDVRGIPQKVWEGDGGTLSVEVESTTPARFSISFSDDKDRSLEAWTPVKAGSHTWSVNIPRGAGGYIQLGAENPKVGDKLSWKIMLNGKTVETQSETLEEPLTSGYAFFLQSEYDDYSTLETDEDY